VIVDCHTHLWKAGHWGEQITREAALARGAPAPVNVDETDHWQAMAPVDKAVVFGLRAAHVGLVVPNDLVACYVAEHPEKLIGFAAIDPLEPDYLDEMRRCFETLDFRGLKLGPTYQNCHPMDQRLQPVYAYCETRGIPVLFHQGTTFTSRAPLQYAHPVLLEEVALRYPELRMVIAHMGHPWVEDTLVLIRKQPYVYADISALYYRPWQFYNALVAAVEYGAAHKLLFGTDYPFTTAADSIAGLRNVNHVAAAGMPRVSEDVIEGILHRDTLSLLGC
jgi:hypothetical protein